MITKSSATNKSTISSLIEYCSITVRGCNTPRIVIMNDGYVVDCSPKKGYNFLYDKYACGNIDKYLKEYPDRIIIKDCESLVSNIKKYTFNIVTPKPLDDLSNFTDASVRGCDGSYQFISLFDNKYTIQGYLLESSISTLLSLSREKLLKLDQRYYDHVRIADTMLNIARGVYQTKLNTDCLSVGISEEYTKKFILSELLGMSVIENSNIVSFLNNTTPTTSYFAGLNWFDNKYYFINNYFI